MNFDELVVLVDAEVYAKTQRHLRDIDVLVLRESLNQKSYDRMAEENDYTGQYLRQDVGPKLWQLLSVALGEKINKKNCESILRRHWQAAKAIASPQGPQTASLVPSPLPPMGDHVSREDQGRSGPLRMDWGEAVESPIFYGREEELRQLHQWVQHCRLIALLGMGGIGKTTLLVKLAKQVQGQFDVILWRSLRNAPRLTEILADFFDLVGLQLPAAASSQLQRDQFLEGLRGHRCLIILDNLEAIRGRDREAESYAVGYEDYEILFQQVAATRHQSCLVITSREKPLGFDPRDEGHGTTRVLTLPGLSVQDGKQIFQARGIQSLDRDCLQQILDHYGGNPLALKIVAAAVVDLCEGDLSIVVPFLNRGLLQFQDVGDLLGRQFSRLSTVERQVMYWLALHREPITLRQLNQDVWRTHVLRQLPEAVQSLSRSGLLDRSVQQISLQPVVMEYVTHRFLHNLADELLQLQYASMQTYALLNLQTQDSIRRAQQRFILKPLLDQLQDYFESPQALSEHLQAFLGRLRQEIPQQPGYACGNLLNLLRLHQGTLHDLDCSCLSVWQADLVGISLHRMNFSHTDLSRSCFSTVLSTTRSVSFSPNGRFFALGQADNSVRVWCVQPGSVQNSSVQNSGLQNYQEWLLCQGHQNWVSAVTFCSESQRLISGSFDKTLKLWDLETGFCLKTLVGHTGWIWSVACAPASKIIASSGDDGTIRIWNQDTGDCLQVLRGHRGSVWSLAFSPDGKRLASASADPADSVTLWDLATGTARRLIPADLQRRVRSLAFSPDGQVVVTGSLDCRVEFWDLASGTCLQQLRGHDQAILCLTFEPPEVRGAPIQGLGPILATGSQDCTIRLWDSQTGHCLRTLRGHPHGVSALAFHPTQPLLVSGGHDPTVKLWNSHSGQALHTLQGYSTGLKAIALSPDETRLASAGDSGQLHLWDGQSYGYLQKLRGHSSGVWSLAFTHGGRSLLSGSHDHSIQRWNLETGQVDRTYLGHRNLVLSLALSQNDTFMVSGSEDHTVRLWDLHSGADLGTLLHPGPVWAVVLSPDDQILASGHQDARITLWEVQSQTWLTTLEGHTSAVLALAVSPTGRQLVSGSGDGTAKIWSLKTGDCLQTLRGHRDTIWSVAYSRSGSLIATGGNDGTLRLWDSGSGALLRTLYGHDSALWALVFRQNGQIISASQEGTIKVWDVDTGHCLHSLREILPYEGMQLTGAQGLTAAQRTTLTSLGAIP
ncbi:WD40 domain-containing protein [Lyngbya confervoides]|uniref:NB-ARC domain-containing protein n=1 Tax=Lyngbya confervoides BDU141951 TaxID=1574623 RepID=A0ABD4T139_9CYAN|nr:NB-ARC domain-containing protein [Lyngbya confervoides]MCM1982017.1 NB-ARC domain-containing protein [Lyngbya confervoides BDU141951]